jgi:hypothetical protein
MSNETSKEKILVDLFALKMGLQDIAREISELVIYLPVNEDMRALFNISMAAMKENKIGAIKAIRMATNWGLVESKDFVESPEADKFANLGAYLKSKHPEIPIDEGFVGYRDGAKEKFPILAQNYMKLVAKHHFLIHESDFENLDYLIYLFATNRSDTMKEALQLLDEEKRTQRIILSVENASRYLADSFRSIMYAMGEQIVNAIKASGIAISQATFAAGMMASNEIVGAIKKVHIAKYLDAKGVAGLNFF